MCTGVLNTDEQPKNPVAETISPAACAALPDCMEDDLPPNVEQRVDRPARLSSPDPEPAPAPQCPPAGDTPQYAQEMLRPGSQSPPRLPPVSPTALHAQPYACNYQSPPSTQSSGELANSEDFASWDMSYRLEGSSDEATDGSEAGYTPTFDEVVAQAMYENRIAPSCKPQYDKLQQQLEVLLRRVRARHTVTTIPSDVQFVDGGDQETGWHSVAGERIGTSDKTCLQYT
jgi:hypothetical protein